MGRTDNCIKNHWNSKLRKKRGLASSTTDSATDSYTSEHEEMDRETAHAHGRKRTKEPMDADSEAVYKGACPRFLVDSSTSLKRLNWDRRNCRSEKLAVKGGFCSSVGEAADTERTQGRLTIRAFSLSLPLPPTGTLNEKSADDMVRGLSQGGRGRRVETTRGWWR